MRQINSLAILIFIVIVGIGGALTYAMYRPTASLASVGIGVSALVLALVVSAAIKVANLFQK